MNGISAYTPFIVNGFTEEVNMTTHRINAAVLHAVGESPRYESFPAPQAGEETAVIGVTAAALKPSDRAMANGIHYAPTAFPQVVGLDGVGRLADGSRVAFMIPQPPFGGMAEQTLLRRGAWFPVPDGVDDVTAAAVLNPGGAAWKTIVWEGAVAEGSNVLILGATGLSGRIATHLALRRGARVVVAGRNRQALDALVARGADAAIPVDRSPDDLRAAVAAAAPYDLICDYLWGPPVEAVFGALAEGANGRRPITHILVGMTAGEVIRLPAMTLRRAPVHLMGSGSGRPLPVTDAARGYAEVLDLVTGDGIDVAARPVALADVERTWGSAAAGRVVFVP